MGHKFISSYRKECFTGRNFLKAYQPKHVRYYLTSSLALCAFKVALNMAGKSDNNNLPVVYRSLESVLQVLKNEKVTEY